MGHQVEWRGCYNEYTVQQDYMVQYCVLLLCYCMVYLGIVLFEELSLSSVKVHWLAHLEGAPMENVLDRCWRSQQSHEGIVDHPPTKKCRETSLLSTMRPQSPLEAFSDSQCTCVSSSDQFESCLQQVCADPPFKCLSDSLLKRQQLHPGSWGHQVTHLHEHFQKCQGVLVEMMDEASGWSCPCLLSKRWRKCEHVSKCK
jgi:hypothetical protein